MGITRRRFIEGAVGALAASAAVPADAQGLPRRTLGRTRQQVSLIGLGMAPLGSAGTPPEDVEHIVGEALDLGINYVDVAPDYDDAEARLKPVLARRRKEVFLVTKVNAGQQSRDGVLRQLDASLRRMGVDHVDAVHLHNLGDFDMGRVFAPDGALAGLKAARDRGMLRFIGCSGHTRPPRFVRALASGDVDLVMNPLNFVDRANYAFEDLVLPAARKAGAGVVAMKVLGGALGWRYNGRTAGCFAAYHERAIRYSLGLPGVCCAVVGISSLAELRQAVDVARRCRPLADDERDGLLAEGRRLAARRGLYFGPVDG